jgi:putative ABC transport system ATP-binding protein
MAETNKDDAVEITLKGIKKTYQMGEVLVPVLHGIDLELHRGKLTVILGASGSGKSTLLNMIGGIDKPTEGTIMFQGQDIAQLNDRKLTEYRRKSVGFVFQFYNLVATLSARENVQVSTEVADESMPPDEALEHVGLGDRMGHFPAQMSGGQQQRVAIARALAKKPRLMLCDEPTGALDHDTSIMVLDLLQKLNRDLGTTIIMITHAPPIAAMADHVVYLGSGVVDKVEVNENPKTAGELDW